MRRTHLGAYGLLASSFALAVTANAQIDPLQANVGGLGSLRLLIDTDAQVGSALQLGVVHLGNEIFVSGRDDAASFHQVYVFDGTGSLVRQFDQLESSATSAWGYRDGATDGSSLMFGNENGLFVISHVDGSAVNTVQATNGAQNLASNPITGPGLTAVGNYRGVAYNPRGNAGNGSVFTGSFGSDIVEIDLAGNVLNTLTNSGWSAYGLAYDPRTGNLWVNAAPNAGHIAELDSTTGSLTGASFDRTVSGSSQGGLSLGPTGANGEATLVGLDQATPDTVSEYRLHLYTSPVFVDGASEARLMTSVGADPLDDDHTVQTYASGDSVNWQITQPAGSLFTPGFVVFNFGSSATTNATTSLTLNGPAVPEFVAQSAISNPSGFGIIYPVLAGGTASAVVPSGFQPNLEYTRLQGLYLHPTGAFMATNQSMMQFLDPDIQVICDGSNSFNSNTGSGYFQVRHLKGADITSVQFDWVNSSVSGQSTMEFDTNQSSMADRFDGGDLGSTGCINTYRNGSDVATGLVYASTNASPCDPAATGTGWVGTNAGNSTNDWRTLDFTFTPGSFQGNTFEFDCDTDGGLGAGGDDMQGMVVTINLSDGTIHSGEVQAIASDLGGINFF